MTASASMQVVEHRLMMPVTYPSWGLCIYTPIHIGYIWLDVQDRGTVNNISTSEHHCVTTDMIYSGYTQTCRTYNTELLERKTAGSVLTYYSSSSQAQQHWFDGEGHYQLPCTGKSGSANTTSQAYAQ